MGHSVNDNLTHAYKSPSERKRGPEREREKEEFEGFLVASSSASTQRFSISVSYILQLGKFLGGTGVFGGEISPQPQ